MEMLKTITMCLTGAVVLAAAACSGLQTLVAQDAKAGEVFYVKLETSKGDVILEVHPEWAPIGAAHFKELVEAKFYDDCRFFRVLKEPRPFMAQVGMNGDPKVQAKWGEATIKDEPVKKQNKRGFVTYAKSRLPNSRSTQIFINYGDNSQSLDPQGFAPFAMVVRGMPVVDSLYGDYGEGGEGGPTQDAISAQGNKYLNEKFPKLDYIKKATIITKAEFEGTK
jgi:peptidyl-prolyl cis-trans isomerase A (cyclophilin A)